MPGFLSETAIQDARQQYSGSGSGGSGGGGGGDNHVATFSTRVLSSIIPYTSEQRQAFNPNQQQQQQQQPFYYQEQQQSQYQQYQGDMGGVNFEQAYENPQQAEASITDLLNKLKDTESSNNGHGHGQGGGNSPSTDARSASGQVNSSNSMEGTMTTTKMKDEDFSHGRITPQLLKRLAALVEEDSQHHHPLLNELNRLKEKQMALEKQLFEDRQALLTRQGKDMVKLQASEIMGVDVRDKTRQMKQAHRQALIQFDQNVVWEMDKLIQETQVSLSTSFQIPMFRTTNYTPTSTTTDPAMISSQIKVIRLLEEMLQE
ncbi:hypothetical protein BG004_003390 [Podila humilis]|nr:hypothetical protein BG004_003390 [Podila humilis]